MNKRRDYQSTLRQEQAKRTREQILEGLARVVQRDGLAELSIPAVALEADVSVPTIYRYFRTKHDLVQALGSYTVEKARMLPSTPLPPRNPEELIATITELFIRYDSADATLQAVMGEVSSEMRQQMLPYRLALLEDALRPVLGNFNQADQARLRKIVFILTTTATMRAFKEHLNLSGVEAADSVAWAIRTLTSASSQLESE